MKSANETKLRQGATEERPEPLVFEDEETGLFYIALRYVYNGEDRYVVRIGRIFYVSSDPKKGLRFGGNTYRYRPSQRDIQRDLAKWNDFQRADTLGWIIQKSPILVWEFISELVWEFISEVKWRLRR